MSIYYFFIFVKVLNVLKFPFFNIKKAQKFRHCLECFSGVLILFFVSCTKGEVLKSSIFYEPSLNSALYFQNTKFSLQEIFEKNCFRLSFLFFHPSEAGNTVTYSEIYLSAYAESFLKSANEKFPNALKKYSLMEQIKEGKFQKIDSKIQIQFYKAKQKKLEANELLDLVNEFHRQGTQKITQEKEIWTLKPRKEDTLWKESEKFFSDGSTYFWVYHEHGELMHRHHPFIAYSANEGEVVYSRLLNTEENIFLKQKEENFEKNFKLYSNRDYAVYYLPNEQFLDFQIFSKDLKTQKFDLTLLKNQFPILLYKKNLNTNGN